MGSLSDQLPSPPLVVAITVHRNDLSGLRRTCASFDRQTYAHASHLVIDGASSDGTLEWLATVGASPRRKFVSQSDAGIYDAMNRGIELAEGAIVTFLNAGDELPDPETLAFAASSWRQEQWRWAVGAIRYVTKDGEPTHLYRAKPISLRRMELGLNFLPHPAAYFETQFLRELGGFSLECSVAADQEIMLRALRLERPTLWDRVMSNFEAGGASSQLSEWETQRLWHRIRGAHHAYVANSPVLDSLYGLALAGFRTSRSKLRQLNGRS